MKLKTSILTIVAGMVLVFSSCEKKPTSIFTFTGANVQAPDTVVFTNRSTNANAYLWDFGDFTNSSNANPIHVYTTDGTYKVVLYATTGNKTAQSSQMLTVLKPPGGAPYLCTGETGVSSFFPLVVGNTWTYSYNYSQTGYHDTYTVTDTLVMNGFTYYQVYCNQLLFQTTINRYFRIDASGSIREYQNGMDFLFLPNSPTTNQDIGYSYDFEGNEGDRTVISTDATIYTGSCTYSNCLEIQGSTGYDYFVRGLGCVYSEDYQLAGATLK